MNVRQVSLCTSSDKRFVLCGDLHFSWQIFESFAFGCTFTRKNAFKDLKAELSQYYVLNDEAILLEEEEDEDEEEESICTKLNR